MRARKVQFRIKFGGERFWLKKAQGLQDKRDRERARAEYTRRKEQRRLRKLQHKKIRKKMGFCRYTCCPLERKGYEELFPIETNEKTEQEMAQEQLEAARKERERARKEAELAIKNPETNEWKLYLKRKQERGAQSGAVVPAVGGGTRGNRESGAAATRRTAGRPGSSGGAVGLGRTIEVRSGSLSHVQKDQLRSASRLERRDARRARKKIDK